MIDLLMNVLVFIYVNPCCTVSAELWGLVDYQGFMLCMIFFELIYRLRHA